MSDSQRARIRLLVSGRVQGVGFRYATVREARRFGLLGWVRNTSDGRVEIVAEGDLDALEALASWSRVGPPGARVEAVTRVELEPGELLEQFTVR